VTTPPVSLTRMADVLRGHGLEVELRAPEDAAVAGVSQDSRAVTRGALFLAWKGGRHDAHDFLGQVAEAGAGAALVERFVDEVDLPQLRVSDARLGAGIAAMLAVGDPGTALHMTAVTGTNGKTTVAVLLRHLLAQLGPAAALGTLGVVGPDGGAREGTGGLTTPGPAELAHRLRALVDEGVEYLVLEASSHALDQRRLDALRFQAALFTNLTRDHLDYHGTEAAYLAAKGRLVELLRPGGEVVVHAGDPAWAGLPRIAGTVRPVGFAGAGLEGVPAAEARHPPLVARDVRLEGTGSRFLLEEQGAGPAHPVTLPLLGRFNVENALVAAGGAMAAGLSLEAVARGLSTAPAPTGRMEITATAPVPVILDYAHTPDALARALETLAPLYPGRVIVVFGAGGDRDRTKRPEMGRIAAAGAGWAIATSDNPRTEDPDGILDEVVAGMPEGGAWERITDRRAAIARALELARPGDAVLLAGKGHETYQVVGTEVRPFDERRVVRELLAGAVAP
jgi:UDP-N-acetylmuramoyl-L-alanyl-D-glutamate--2,6-diaminopimelate ligase